MGPIPTSRRLGRIAVATAAALGIGLSGAPGATATPSKLNHPSPRQVAADRNITLITGDRVTLAGGDPNRLALTPGPGRKQLTFSAVRAGNHLYVVPSDIQPQIASGRLDRQLFDVNELIKAGYDDESATSIPLLVTYAGQAKQRAALPAATVTHQLPSINGAALKVDKTKAAGFLAATTARSATGIDKVWLDGKRKALLDQSVPQIGGPVAWQAGYTGKGVSVAVLDTGIDVSHPDLATQVIGPEKNFTGSPDGDHFGHGTHVASIIAGTAAASNGKYKGVTPDAKLYDGKVCEDSGSCSDSSILAGFEWAANDVKAKIVNLSVGGPDTPGVDPLEEAVNRLTATTGTLFVIAAGNEGPDAGTIDSPGSADAALTVGAVDKQDQLADFSSQGPRVGDGALKPDVTAPGVSIVAAKAKDSVIGEPVGDQYLRLSGTSMATPHVAGAAALLLQEHPDWTAKELKAGLMASAKPADNQTAFQQGAGRIDLTRGIKQTVLADPGSVSFGTAQWPHNDDTPVTKPLTYRNLGEQPVTLSLATTYVGPDGAAAPAGSLQLSADTVTVPAHGTATVQVTSNTNHSGPDGAYSGRITATAGDIQVTTPVGAVRETEHHTLTVTTTGPDGKPGSFSGYLSGLAGPIFDTVSSPQDSAFVRRLPPGKYMLEAETFVPDPNHPGKLATYELVAPTIDLSADATVHLDFRTTKQVKVTVPKAGAAPALAMAGYDREPVSADGIGLKSLLLPSDFTAFFTGQVGDQGLPPDELTSFVGSQWGVPGPDGSFGNTPYLYLQRERFPGRMVTGFIRNVRDDEMAVVHQQFNATSDRKVEVWHVVDSDWDSSPSAVLYYDQPADVTVLADDKPVNWVHVFREVVPDTDPNAPGPWRPVLDVVGTGTYQAGKTYHERYNAAAFTVAPAFAARQDGDLVIQTYGLLDADGHRGDTSRDTASSQLLRDGSVVAQSSGFGYIGASGLPATKATYTLVASQTRPSYSAYSPRTDLRWTFTSGATSDQTALPYLGVRYEPKVDRHNVADRTPVTVLPVSLVAQDGAAVPKVRSVDVQVSGDGGATWQTASVAPTGTGGYQAVFATPKGAKALSLQAHVVDATGNVLDETTIGAYPLR